MLVRLWEQRRSYLSGPRLVVVIIAVVVLIGAVRHQPQPLMIGFLGSLTGRGSLFSIAGRNGTMLAIEETNAAGGVLGRRVQLAVASYEDNGDDVREAFQHLLDADVEAVVGPMTSAASVKLMQSDLPEEMVLFSPTSEASTLAGVEDQFFRIAPASSVSVKMLTEHVFATRGVHTVAIVRDTDNDAFTRDWQEEFCREFTKHGGAVKELIGYSSSRPTSFTALLRRVAEAGVDGVLLLTHAADTALFCQQVAKSRMSLPCFCTSWASSPVLTRMGGHSVEGLTWVQGSSYDAPNPAYQSFKLRYKKRFNQLPDYSALHAYEATGMLLLALAGDEERPLRERLLDLGSFVAPQDTLVMSPAGDVIRDLHLLSIRNGEIVSIDHSREPFTALLNR